MPDRSALDGTYVTLRTIEANRQRFATGAFQCLRIKSRGDETVWFELVLVEENEMSCTVRGKAHWTGDGFELRAPDEATVGEEPPCTVQLKVTPTSIVLDDARVGPRCHSYYCGASAPLLADFSRSERSKDGAPCPEAPTTFLDSIEDAERFIEQRLRDLDTVPDEAGRCLPGRKESND